MSVNLWVRQCTTTYVTQQRVRVRVVEGSSNVDKSDVQARLVLNRDGESVLLAVDKILYGLSSTGCQ